MNFRYRLMQFMSGRYGTDTLTYILLGASIILSVFNIFLSSFIIRLASDALIIYALFRMLSRNIYARRKENQWVRDKLGFLKRKKELYERRKNDKCHIYKKCPACKAILRLPRRVGNHTTVCPKCGREFGVKVRK